MIKSSKARKGIYANHCGPFLDKYYPLVIIDSSFRWPEDFFTALSHCDLKLQALGDFGWEGDSLVLVTDNGLHFAADTITT